MHETARERAITGPVNADRPKTKLPVALLAALAAMGVVFFLHAARSFLIPVVLAILISYMLDPVVTALERYRVPRTAGAVLTSLALAGSIAYAGYGLADNAARIAAAVPAAAERLREAIFAGRSGGDGTIDGVLRVAEPLLSAGDYFHWGTAALGFLGRAASVLFLAFFMLASGDLYKRKIVKVAGSTISTKRITVEILEEIRVQIGRFLLVQLAIGAMVAASTWGALVWMGVEQPVFWGLAAGIFSTVPYFGPMIVALGLGVTAFARFGTLSAAIYVLCAAAAVAGLKGFVVAPWLTGKATRMNQVAILTGLVFWIWIWGIPGMLLALPILATIKAICDRVAGLAPIAELLSE